MTPRDPFAVLQSALAITPSPEFAARARARVAAAPARALSLSWRSAWMFGAVAVASAVLVTMSVVRTRSVAVSVETPNVAAAPEPIATTAARVTPPAVAAPRMRPALRVAYTATTSMAPPDPFHEVIVPDDQRLALVRLLESLKAGRVSVPRAAVTTELDDDGNRVITPLPSIVPMKIEPLAAMLAENIKREDIKREPK